MFIKTVNEIKILNEIIKKNRLLFNLVTISYYIHIYFILIILGLLGFTLIIFLL